MASAPQEKALVEFDEGLWLFLRRRTTFAGLRGILITTESLPGSCAWTELNVYLRQRIGDDLRWAQADYDDSAWTPVRVPLGWGRRSGPRAATFPALRQFLARSPRNRRFKVRGTDAAVCAEGGPRPGRMFPRATVERSAVFRDPRLGPPPGAARRSRP